MKFKANKNRLKKDCNAKPYQIGKIVNGIFCYICFKQIGNIIITQEYLFTRYLLGL